MKKLSVFEERLRGHFKVLSSDRIGEPVFLIEHGLAQGVVSELLKAVGAFGNAVGFRSEMWRPYRLSLGVALTEFGYQYRGAGTEFWGFAERGLGVEISLSERAEITAVFKRLSRDYDIAIPLNDRWSEAFGHIAWPIRNAMVSREIHSPLASLIRRALRNNNALVLNASFVSSLRYLASGLSSKRLEAWLSDEGLALSVVRALADGSARGLKIEPTFMGRLDEDLRRNREVRQLSLSARVAKHAANLVPRKLPRPLYQLLIHEGEPVGLGIRGPALNTEELAHVAALTDGESREAILSIGGRSVPLRDFLSGETIFIGRPRKLPTPDLTGISGLSETIANLALPAESFLFSDIGSDGYQPQIPPGSRISDDVPFFELRLEETDQDDWGSAVYGLRANSPEGTAKLLANGIAISQREIVEFFGGATLVQSKTELSQVEGHDLWLKAETGLFDIEVRAPEGEVMSSISLPNGEWVRIDVRDKPCSLHLTDGHNKHSVELTFRSRGGVEPLGIELFPQELTLNDVGAGVGSIGLKAPSRLDGATVRVSLTDVNGNTVTCEAAVETMPSVVGFSCTGMDAIRQAAQKWSYSGKTATLRAEVTGLASTVRLLPVRHQEWMFNEKERTWETSEGKHAQSLILDPSLNPVSPCHTVASAASEVGLFLPDIYDDQRLNAGVFVVNARQIHLYEIGPKKVLQIRKNRISGKESDGLIGASEALVAWQTATATNVVSDGIRRRVGSLVEDGVVKALCGEGWLSTEKRLQFVKGGFHKRLVHFALERKLAAGNNNFDEIDDAGTAVLEKYLLSAFKETLPNPSALVVPDGDEWPDLDNAVNSAWTMLGHHLEEAEGINVDGDCIVFDGEWQKAVVDAREADYLRPLARKIIPITRSFGLLQFRYLEASFDDLISELNDSHTDVQRVRRHISPEALRTLLSLFLLPSQIVEDPDWRSHVARFASDRFSARAVRYAALRYGAVH
ncbi:MAG: hypothetical protein ABJL72_09065 [Roseobacter sp.]